MAKKKKGNKKLRKKEKQRIMSMSFDELMTKGDATMAAGKPRDAIKLFKMAIKASKSATQSEKVYPCIFSAYLGRIKELNEKNMMTEAAALQKQAMEYMPSPASMDSSTMIIITGLCDIKEAIEHCKQYVRHKDMDPQLGVVLADRLLTENAWHLLNEKKDPLGFFSDAAIVKSCVPLMDDGQWQQAAEGMKALPRKSFFAHVRMFCRAMALFNDGDDKNMYKAISLIPEGSVFRKITDCLESGIKSIESSARIKGDNAFVSCLWDGPINLWQMADQIVELTEKQKFNAQLKQLITSFSKEILPADPIRATRYLLESMWQVNMLMDKFRAFERRLLNKKNAEMLDARKRIVFIDDPLENASVYIDELRRSGTDSETLGLLESLIVFHVCRHVTSGRLPNYFANMNDKTAKRFAMYPKADFDTLLMKCAAWGLECDPGNRGLYELVAKFNAMSRTSKTIKEQLLLSMCDVYQDDPYPCIELASLYHGKNAFRKAENILKEAMKRAPYDSRVQDLHVIALLISADKCLNKHNFSLVWKDWEKARSIDTGTNAVLLREKELFYKICEKPVMPEKVIGIQLDDLSGFERLKIVSMLRMDAETKPKQNHSKILRKIKSFFSHELKGLSRLTSKEVMALLKPFPREWQNVFKTLNIHRLFFQTTDKVLTHLDDTDLLCLVDQILCPENFLVFQQELNRRTMTRKSGDELLMFYALIMDGVEDNDWDLIELTDLLDEVGPENERKNQGCR